MEPNKFYIYEHWRPDTEQCFYVGKGSDRRGYDIKFGRNIYYNRIVAKLSRLMLQVKIVIVTSGLTETEAFTLEKERIAFWRNSGVRLSNKTTEGDGIYAQMATKENHKNRSESARRRWQDQKARVALSAQMKKSLSSPETRRKMSESAIKRHASIEAQAKRAAKKKEKDRLRKLRYSPKYHKKLQAKMKRIMSSPKVRANMRAAAKKRWADPDLRARHLVAIRKSWEKRRKAKENKPLL